MARYLGISRDSRGNNIGSAKVYVYDVGTTTTASIYEDDAFTTAVSNPMTSDSDGTYEFYAPPGEYKLKVAKPGYADFLKDNVVIGTFANNYTTAEGNSGAKVGDTGIFSHSASPEGVITANPGSICMVTDGTFYLKETGTGNTGWESSVICPVNPTSKAYVGVYDKTGSSQLKAWLYADGTYSSVIQSYDYTADDWEPPLLMDSRTVYVASTNQVVMLVPKDGGNSYVVAWDLDDNSIIKSPTLTGVTAANSGLQIVGDTLYVETTSGTDDLNVLTHALSTLASGAWAEQTGINAVSGDYTIANIVGVTGNGEFLSPCYDNTGAGDGLWWKHPGTDNPLTANGFGYNGAGHRYTFAPISGDYVLVWVNSYMREANGAGSFGIAKVDNAGAETYVTPVSWESAGAYTGIHLSTDPDGSDWMIYDTGVGQFFTRIPIVKTIDESCSWPKTTVDDGPDGQPGVFFAKD
jgi:hypothetical protein